MLSRLLSSTGLRAAGSSSSVPRVSHAVAGAGVRGFVTPATRAYTSKKKNMVEEPTVPKPPPRPLSRFSRYILANKDVFKTVEGKAGPEGFKIISLRWRELTEQEKKTYDAPEKEMQEYKAAYAQWEKEIHPKDLKALNKARVANGKLRIKAKAPSGLKKPPLAFALFTQEQYPLVSQTLDAGQGRTVSVVGVEIAKRWRAMSDEEKQPYVDEAKRRAAAYQEQLKEFEARQTSQE